VVTRDPANVD